MAPESLSEEAEPLELQVSWINTNVQAFGDIWDGTLCVKKVEATHTLTYLASMTHSSTGCEPHVSRNVERTWSASNSLDESV